MAIQPLPGRTHVLPGQPATQSAREYNNFLQTAAQAKATLNDLSGGGDWPERDGDKVSIENRTGHDREAFDCVQLGEVIILDPSTNNIDGHLEIMLEGNTPDNLRRHAAVLMEPIPAGSGGRAWVSGVHPARVNVLHTEHRRATLTQNHYLQSDMIGPYEILNSLGSGGLQTCMVKKSNRISTKLAGRVGSGGISGANWHPGSGAGDGYLDPGYGTVTIQLWNDGDAQYRDTTMTMVVYNISDPIEPDQPILFSVDDDGLPTVEVVRC